jgi:hypothetical protein
MLVAIGRELFVLQLKECARFLPSMPRVYLFYPITTPGQTLSRGAQKTADINGMDGKTGFFLVYLDTLNAESRGRVP